MTHDKVTAPKTASDALEDAIEALDRIQTRVRFIMPASFAKVRLGLTAQTVDVDTAMKVLWDAGYKIHGEFGWVQDHRDTLIERGILGGKS